MPNRILALDLQASRIVALVVETSFRGYRFVAHHCEPRDPSRPLAEQLRDVVSRHGLAADTVVSALPGPAAVHRILHLPFRDRRKLAQTVPFEIESRIPIPLEEGVVDFQVLSRSAEGSTIFAALAPRERLTEHLGVLTEAGLDPEIVDFAPLSTLNVLQLFEGERPGRYGFLHVLGSQGTLALYEDGILRQLRVFDADGESCAHALTREIAWTLRSFDGAAPVPEEAPLPLVVGGDPPAELLETLPGRLGLRIQRLEELPLRHVPEEVREQQGTYATAIGLALREIAEAPTLGINFRRGEFAYRRAQQELRETLSRLGILAGVVAALFVLSAFVSYFQLSSRYEELRQAVRTVFTATLPGERVVLDETAQLQQAIEGLRRRQQQFGGGPVSVLEVLREVSLRAPTEPRMNLDELAFDAEGLRVRGRTSSFEAVEGIKRSLAESRLFREVQVKDPRTTPDGNVEFRLVLLFGRGQVP
jgi:general secretion pathway protein L